MDFLLTTAIIEKITAIVSFIGTVANIICFLICLCGKELRKYPTFIFFGLISLSEAFAVSFFNMQFAVASLFNSLILLNSVFYVKLSFYINYVSASTASTLLVY